VQKIINHLERSPRSLKEVRPELPEELVRLVEKMMAKDPGARFQSPAEVAAALLPFVAPNSPDRGTHAAPHHLGSHHRRWFWIGSAAVAVLLLGIGYFFGPNLGQNAPERKDHVNLDKDKTSTGAAAKETPPAKDLTPLEKASCQGRCKNLLKMIDVPEDLPSYGPAFEYGPYTGTEWAGHKDLPPGYWVYVYPNWYIWGEATPPPEEPLLERAKRDGKYSNLLRKITVRDDFQLFGMFHDWGYYDGTEWAGHKDLPPGYWVYVFPNWYIWKDVDTKSPLSVSPKKDMLLLQGKWFPVAGELGGKPMSEDQLSKIAFVVFVANRMLVSQDGKSYEGQFALDSSKSPKWITVKRSEGINKYGLMDGIYELDGDTLRLCMGEPEDPRPITFTSVPGQRVLYLTLTRKKNGTKQN
jgi:uncharacterized protein (TIGR03067 family)